MDGSNETTTSSTNKDTMADKARAAASSVKTQAGEEIEARAAQTQEDIAAEVSGTADALRKAASEVRDGSPQGSAFSYAAERLADVSDSIRGQDLGQTLETVTHYARRHPIAFLGGAVALGMAAGRFAKSSGTSHYAEHAGPSGGTGYSAAAGPTGTSAQTGYGTTAPRYGDTQNPGGATVPQPTAASERTHG